MNARITEAELARMESPHPFESDVRPLVAEVRRLRALIEEADLLISELGTNAALADAMKIGNEFLRKALLSGVDLSLGYLRERLPALHTEAEAIRKEKR